MTISPASSIRRTPKRPTYRELTVATTTTVTVVASQNTPVLVGEYPNSCCITNEPMKMNASSAQYARNAVTFATTSVRFFSVDPGTSGATERRSIQTNVA